MVVERLAQKKTGTGAFLRIRVAVPPRTATPVFPEHQYRSGDGRLGGYLSYRSRKMKTFRVWIRPLCGVCRVRVDGITNAMWLLTRLSRSFVFKSGEPMEDDKNASSSTFYVPCSSQVSHFKFEKLLAGSPQVQLMPEPA
jgi:hypothetical protein